METLEKINELDKLIDGMRVHVAGYGEASNLLRSIKKDVENLQAENKHLNKSIWLIHQVAHNRYKPERIIQK